MHYAWLEVMINNSWLALMSCQTGSRKSCVLSHSKGVVSLSAVPTSGWHEGFKLSHTLQRERRELGPQWEPERENMFLVSHVVLGPYCPIICRFSSFSSSCLQHPMSNWSKPIDLIRKALGRLPPPPSRDVEAFCLLPHRNLKAKPGNFGDGSEPRSGRNLQEPWRSGTEGRQDPTETTVSEIGREELWKPR